MFIEIFNLYSIFLILMFSDLKQVISGLPIEAERGDAEAQIDCYGLGDFFVI